MKLCVTLSETVRNMTAMVTRLAAGGWLHRHLRLHLRLAVQPSWIVDISDQWPKKLAAIESFQSQFVTGRPTESPTILDRIRDDAAYWGRLINRDYGEPFATKEPLAISSLRDII